MVGNRGHDVKPIGCAHGYPAATECPRCGVRESAPERPVSTATRWDATVTTLGPVPKLVISFVVVFPVVTCFLALSRAGAHVENTFMAVPLWMFGVIAAVVLYHVWEVGHKGVERE